MACDPLANKGWTTLSAGTSVKDVTFTYTDFNVCEKFEYDCDTDGGGTNGAAHAGASVTVTLSDLTVLVGVLAADPNDSNRAFLIL